MLWILKIRNRKILTTTKKIDFKATIFKVLKTIQFQLGRRNFILLIQNYLSRFLIALLVYCSDFFFLHHTNEFLSYKQTTILEWKFIRWNEITHIPAQKRHFFAVFNQKSFLFFLIDCVFENFVFSLRFFFNSSKKIYFLCACLDSLSCSSRTFAMLCVVFFCYCLVLCATVKVFNSPNQFLAHTQASRQRWVLLM